MGLLLHLLLEFKYNNTGIYTKITILLVDWVVFSLWKNPRNFLFQTPIALCSISSILLKPHSCILTRSPSGDMIIHLRGPAC